MATIVPSLSRAVTRVTPGERRFARRLESKLEDDYLCWYEPRVGARARARYTDFIVLHPGRGLLLLEVKDWKPDTIRRADRQMFELLLDTGLKRVANPLEQVRRCTYRLIDALKRDPALRRAEGRHAGSLVCPYAYGVVLTGITRAQFDKAGLDAVLPGHLVICRDEMTSEVDPEAFQTRLWNMFPVSFPVAMTLPQIDRVRGYLFPDIIIPEQGSLLEPFGSGSGTEGRTGGATHTTTDENAEPPVDSMLPEVVRILDRRQETLARNLGEGHRVIHGVAGSGKTLILAYRCVHLASIATKPILVLCFNVTLAARLREMLAARALEERVHIHNFHEWCRRQLQAYHVKLPADGADFHARTVECLVAAVADGRVPRAQYEAVMIDEGHDFEADWLGLAVGMVDPKSNHFLLLYDDAQSIYSKRRTLGFSLKSAGVEAAGRTRILRINYRNTREILAFARRFAHDWLAVGEDVLDEGIGSGKGWEMMPEGGGRHGVEPEVKVLPDGAAEAEHVARHVLARHEAGVSWSDIAVLYRAAWHGTLIERALVAAGVPVYRVHTRADKLDLSLAEPSLKLMTIHDARGLEFPSVVVAGTGAMPGPRAEDVTREAKLLYIGLTRATDNLLVTADRRSVFVERLIA